jgi:hypothetical protein
MAKDNTIEKKKAAHVRAERDILSEADVENPWIVTLHCSFQVRSLPYAEEILDSNACWRHSHSLIIGREESVFGYGVYYRRRFNDAADEEGHFHRDSHPTNCG